MIYYLILHYQGNPVGLSYRTKKAAEDMANELNACPGVRAAIVYLVFPVVACENGEPADYYLVTNQNGKLIRHEVWQAGAKDYAKSKIKRWNRYLIGVAKRKLLAVRRVTTPVCANCSHAKDLTGTQMRSMPVQFECSNRESPAWLGRVGGLYTCEHHSTFTKEEKEHD